MKYMLKKIIIGVSIGLLLFFIKGYIVNAKVSSITFQQGQYYLNNGSNTLVLPLGQVFTGLGNGGVIFNFLKPFNDTKLNEIINIYINRADGTNLSCEYDRNTISYANDVITTTGSVASGYYYYQVNCPIDTTSYGLSNIIIRYRWNETATGTNREYINNMNYVTFYTIADFNSTELINTLNNNNADLKSFLSTQNYYIRNDLTNIYNLLNSNNQQLVNEIKETNKIQQEQNDFLMDDSLPTNTGGDIGDLNNNIATNGTISSLVTMPITFLQKIINGLNGACSPIVIGELYEYNMTMPCINPQQYIGIIWNIIDVICAGFLSFHFGKKLVSIFHKITSMKDGGLEEAYD